MATYAQGRADSRFAATQWETALLCNDVSHWLDASLESVWWVGLGYCQPQHTHKQHSCGTLWYLTDINQSSCYCYTLATVYECCFKLVRLRNLNIIYLLQRKRMIYTDKIRLSNLTGTKCRLSTFTTWICSKWDLLWYIFPKAALAEIPHLSIVW